MLRRIEEGTTTYKDVWRFIITAVVVFVLGLAIGYVLGLILY